MKILFINLPYYGHVVPTIGLVQELINLGCEVDYLLPNDCKGWIIESGARFIGYKNHKQLAEQMKNAYHTAKDIIQEYDLVIYEQFFFLGKHLAEEYQKPVVRIFTAPATNKKLMDAFIQKGPLAIFKNKWICKAFTKDIAKNIALKTDNWLDEIIENPPKLNIVYTFKEYQPYANEFNDSFKFIGPSIYERNKVFNFDKTRPIIYISLGSLVKGSKSFYKKCIHSFKDEDVDIIIVTKKKFINLPNNVHVYEYVPQVEVLKLADVFITHGGMNSISEGMVSKTPMLVIPFASDQFVNADCIEKLNIGMKLDDQDFTSEQLKNMTFFLLRNFEIQKNLDFVYDLIQQSLGNAGAAKLILDYFESNK